MNETEAARYLGVSPRTLQRYRKSGRLPYGEAPGKTRAVILYEDADIARLKEDLDRRRAVGPKPKAGGAVARRVTFGLPPDEHEQLLKEAARYGLGPADYARRLVREKMESRYLKEAEELRAEIRRVEEGLHAGDRRLDGSLRAEAERLMTEVDKVRSDFAAGFEALLEFLDLSPEESRQWVEENLR